MNGTRTLFRSAPELIVNGGMELDSDWPDVGSPDINQRSNVKQHTGSYSRYVADTAYDGCGQAITKVAGHSYVVSFWYYIISGSLSMVLENGDGSGTLMTFGTNEPSITWNSYTSAPVTETISGSTGRIKFLALGSFYIDDVSIREV